MPAMLDYLEEIIQLSYARVPIHRDRSYYILGYRLVRVDGGIGS